jgi:hypothetical protein
MSRTPKVRVLVAGLATAALSFASGIVAVTPANAVTADYNLYSTVYDVNVGAQNGHAGSSSASDWKHGWVCDDRSDGYPVYATFYFDGTFGDTEYTLKAPAHGDGCADGYFDKHIKYFQVYYVGNGEHYGNVADTPY